MIWILVTLPIYLHVDQAKKLSCWGVKWVGWGWWSARQRAGLLFGGAGQAAATWSSAEAEAKPCPRAGVIPCSRNQRGRRRRRRAAGRGSAGGCGAHLVGGEDGGTASVRPGEGETPWLPANTQWERREKTVSQLCVRPRAGQGLGETIPLPSQFEWVRDSELTGWLCCSTSVTTGYPQEHNCWDSYAMEKCLFYFTLRVCWKAKPSYTCHRGRQEFNASNNNKKGECLFRNLSMILMA